MSAVESAGPENAGPDKQDREMVDQQPEVDHVTIGGPAGLLTG